MKYLFIITLLFALLVAPMAWSQGALNIQGVLRDADDNAVEDGTYVLTIKIYDVETGGTGLWEQTYSDVEVLNGIYQVEITPTGLTFTSPYWVGVSVSGGNEMTPRIKLTGAPYALALQGVDNTFPSSGNVGIGTLSPTRNLTVNDSDNETHIELQNGGTPRGYFWWDGDNEILGVGTGVSTESIIFKNGNVGINTTNPEAKLVVAGHINIPENHCLYGPGGIGDGFTYNNGTYNGPVQHYSLGWYPTTGAAEAILTGCGGIKLLVGAPSQGAYVTPTGVYNYSDARLKTNVAPMSNMLDTVMQMRGVTFNLKANDQPSFGFIAQELEEVFPLAVDTDGSGTKAINYANMTAVLVEAVKEQQAQIDALKAEIEALKAIVNKDSQ
jgi:hypothetical protein